jgi:hypothetical protein
MKSTVALPVYMSTADPANCSVVRVIGEDGSTWLNPDLDQELHTVAISALARPPVKVGPIEVTHCVLLIQDAPTLNITFRNTGTAALDRLVIRAAYGTGSIDFVDRGTFAAGAVVKHVLKGPRRDELRHQLYATLDDPTGCTVVSARDADGTAWENPAVAATSAPLPTPNPEAPGFSYFKVHWAQRHVYPSPTTSPGG